MPSNVTSSRPLDLPSLSSPVASRVARTAVVAFVSLCLVTGIVILDVGVGEEVSLSILYVGPILLASWLSGTPMGLAVASAGSLAWYLWDPSESARIEAVPLWNLGARWVTLSLVSVTVGTLRTAIDRERRAAEELKHFNEHLDRQVKERTEGLRRSIREMELFTYTMAHDLRAPLRAIHGLSDLLSREHGGEMPAEAKDWLRRIAGASRRMDQLVLDLLEYGNLIHRPVERKAVDLAAVCRDVLDQARSRIEAVGAEVRVDAPLPCVVGDPTLVSRILEEVVSNALAFGRPGAAVRVRIRGAEEGDRAVVWIEDDGVGIPPEHRRRIFQPFQQLAPPKDDSGTGMGLALVDKALERMDGRIDVASEPDKGSVFRIELPAARGPF